MPPFSPHTRPPTRRTLAAEQAPRTIAARYYGHGSGMDRLFITRGALSGFLAVAAGAFGAHALRDRLTAAMLDVFQTGVTYQMYHALALVGVGILLARFSIDGSVWLTAAGWLFVGGSVLFSGSLYALSLSGTT